MKIQSRCEDPRGSAQKNAKKDCSIERRIGISTERQHNRWRNHTTMNQSILMNRFVNQALIAMILFSAPVLLAGTEAYDTSQEALTPPTTITDEQWTFNLVSPPRLPGLSSTLG